MRSILFLFTIAIFSLTGCVDSSEKPELDKLETPEVETTSGTSVSINKVKKVDQVTEQKTISAQATYIGLMDLHTIEVIINNEPVAIQINEEQMNILESLKTNEQIKIEYYYNEETAQNRLKEVKLR